MREKAGKARLLIVDDHAFMREGIKAVGGGKVEPPGAKRLRGIYEIVHLGYMLTCFISILVRVVSPG